MTQEHCRKKVCRMQAKRVRLIEFSLKKGNTVKNYELEILYKAMYTKWVESDRCLESNDILNDSGKAHVHFIFVFLSKVFFYPFSGLYLQISKMTVISVQLRLLPN